ncbi:MAG: hypothetical protein ACP5QK_09895 [Myxococcota bacterium]
MAADFIKSGIEHLIKKMVFTKEQHLNDLYNYLRSIMPEGEIQSNEVELIINNYEAICGNYVRQTRKKIIRSFGYLNRKLYQNMKSEINLLNERIERINRKLTRLERILE